MQSYGHKRSRGCPLCPRPASSEATGSYGFLGEVVGAGVLMCTHALLTSQALSFVKRLSGLDRALFIRIPKPTTVSGSPESTIAYLALPV